MVCDRSKRSTKPQALGEPTQRRSSNLGVGPGERQLQSLSPWCSLSGCLMFDAFCDRAIGSTGLFTTLFSYFVNILSTGQICRFHRTQTTGTIASPGFPTNYPANLHCSWTIEASRSLDLVVELTIEEFEVEASESCTNDFLTVRKNLKYNKRNFKRKNIADSQ